MDSRDMATVSRASGNEENASYIRVIIQNNIYFKQNVPYSKDSVGTFKALMKKAKDEGCVYWHIWGNGSTCTVVFTSVSYPHIPHTPGFQAVRREVTEDSRRPLGVKMTFFARPDFSAKCDSYAPVDLLGNRAKHFIYECGNPEISIHDILVPIFDTPESRSYEKMIRLVWAREGFQTPILTNSLYTDFYKIPLYRFRP